MCPPLSGSPTWWETLSSPLHHHFQPQTPGVHPYSLPSPTGRNLASAILSMLTYLLDSGLNRK